MGLFDLLRRLLFGAPASPTDTAGSSPAPRASQMPVAPKSLPVATPAGKRGPARKLPPFRYQSKPRRTSPKAERVARRPYTFAAPTALGEYLDLSTDADLGLLDHLGLPRLQTPADIAEWLEIPLGRLAWLSGRFFENHKPQSERSAHYNFRWLKKRSGGHRLIESPKKQLKAVQEKILREILDKADAHPRAFGFIAGRSAILNAREHVAPYVLLKFDLENFYPSVRYSRVVAIYRTLGFSRAAAIWLARLTTSAVPSSMSFPGGDPYGLNPYLSRHLPQGAPTSPALANMSAYGLDVRLTGLARSFGVTYTRYADDLTFSGDQKFAGALRDFIPLTETIIRKERFFLNVSKRRIIRRSGRQTVTGVVVNQHPNLARAEFDRLKAILFNCVRLGPSTQNRTNHPQFAAHLQGRIAHAASINPSRAARLRALYDRIDWSK
ncbi:Reverse transcriptase (RNA-dependent DNA polymerase) [Caulifigura coniformis]|uniref:RNA-directed DNA polymerase n=1 Tax=Caulifigura coniformis TaxID=2527983 RepID=A0A517SHS6_9PLAN|nr:reverse transcriptase family protein [Caulifigura coniformis]QDT55680.1 Reverse transcriptase (RNA-dependent DNA polymerase) [Caulifigura coniformis]